MTLRDLNRRRYLYLENWPDADHTTRRVFVGRKLNTARIDELFAALGV